MGTSKVLSLCVFTLILPNFTSCQPPNIIVLLADDLGWNEVSWNNPQFLTPHLQVSEMFLLSLTLHNPVIDLHRQGRDKIIGLDGVQA